MVDRIKRDGLDPDVITSQPSVTPAAGDQVVVVDATDGELKRALVDSFISGGGSVSSVFGRTGAVVAQAGDYDDSEVSAAASATNYTPAAATVEGHLSGIDSALPTAGPIGSDAPSDGSQYARKDGAWEVVSGGGGGGDTFSWTLGAVGSVAYLSSGATQLSAGDTTAGSNLRYSSSNQAVSPAYNIGLTNNPAPSGTWRCLGILQGASVTRSVSVFVRIA